VSQRFKISRRHFLAMSTLSAAGVSVFPPAMSAAAHMDVAGANERIRLGFVGCEQVGYRRLEILMRLAETGSVAVGAVCDAFEPHRLRAASRAKAVAYTRWEEVVNRPDLDAVLITGPEHIHGHAAIAALETGKDVFCEAPPALSTAEAEILRDRAQASGRVVQIAMPRLAEHRWHAAREMIAAGAIGRVRWCQAGLSWRDGVMYRQAATPAMPTPETLDWEAFLDDAPRRPFDPERYRHWRSYSEYSMGIAGLLHFRCLAPLLFALDRSDGPRRVSAVGGVTEDGGRDLPEGLTTTLEYSDGLVIALSALIGKKAAPAPVLRGETAAIEVLKDALRVAPETGERTDAAENSHPCAESGPSPLEEWLSALRSRGRCSGSPELACATQMAAVQSLQAWRTGVALRSA